MVIDGFNFPDKPSAPKTLTATDVTETSVSLKWQPPDDDGGLPIKSYTIERRDKRWGSWVKAGTTKGSVMTFDVTGLVTGQEYCFRVSAENEEGLGPATEIKEAIMPTREPGKNGFNFYCFWFCFMILDWKVLF